MTDRGNLNLRAAAALLEGLCQEGLAHLALAPGSRSTPLALAAAGRPGLSQSVHLDERSAAFCALGFARASGRPAAMVCTSGTAGANAFGAVIEAWHSRLPLIVLTADRPPELRAAGAWQTIDQQKLFGAFVRDFHELALPDELPPEAAARYARDIGRRAARRSQALFAGCGAGEAAAFFPRACPKPAGCRPSAAAARGVWRSGGRALSGQVRAGGDISSRQTAAPAVFTARVRAPAWRKPACRPAGEWSLRHCSPRRVQPRSRRTGRRVSGGVGPHRAGCRLRRRAGRDVLRPTGRPCRFLRHRSRQDTCARAAP